MGFPNSVPYTNTTYKIAKDLHFRSAYFCFSLFCLVMAIIFATNSMKINIRNEGTELGQIILNTEIQGCNISSHGLSDLFVPTILLESRENEDANLYNSGEISVLNTLSGTLNLSFPALNENDNTENASSIIVHGEGSPVTNTPPSQIYPNTTPCAHNLSTPVFYGTNSCMCISSHTYTPEINGRPPSTQNVVSQIDSTIYIYI